jgi:hypothetical protein
MKSTIHITLLTLAIAAVPSAVSTMYAVQAIEKSDLWYYEDAGKTSASIKI